MTHSDNIARAKKASGEHAICLIEIGGLQFFCDATQGVALASQFKDGVKGWHIGLALDTKTLSYFEIAPMAFDGSVLEIGGNGISDPSQDGLVKLGDGRIQKICDHIERALSRQEPLMFLCDRLDDMELLLDASEKEEIRKEISSRGKVDISFDILGDNVPRTILVL